MKVMCIKPIDIHGPDVNNMTTPEVGDTDTVVTVEKLPFWKATYYTLERFGEDELFNAEYFAILPEQSADEMESQEREAIVNIETAIV